MKLLPHLLSFLLPQCDGHCRFCSGGAVSDEHAQPLGTPQVLLVHPGCPQGYIFRPLTQPSHLWAWDPPCSCSLLWTHTYPAYDTVPHSRLILYPEFQFWRMCQRLYWALRDKENMSHSYSQLKDLWKLKVTDSILSCTGVLVEVLQHVKWCTIKHPGYLLDLSL